MQTSLVEVEEEVVMALESSVDLIWKRVHNFQDERQNRLHRRVYGCHRVTKIGSVLPSGFPRKPSLPAPLFQA